MKFWGQELEQTHSDLQIDEKIFKFITAVEGRIDFGEFIDVMFHKMKNQYLPNNQMESIMLCDCEKQRLYYTSNIRFSRKCKFTYSIFASHIAAAETHFHSLLRIILNICIPFHIPFAF